jgi:hypothetical protein
MQPRCPDTNILVRIINEERNWGACEKHMADASEVVLFQCLIFEVRKVCSSRYMEVADSMMDDRRRNQFLKKYDQKSILYELISKGEYVNQLDVVDGLIRDLPSRIFDLILKHKMRIFPDPFQSSSSYIKNPLEVQTQLEGFVKEPLRLPSDTWLRKKLKEYSQRYDLKKYADEVEKLLSRNPLWFDIKKDMHLLSTYRKATEIWPSLQLLTSDKPLSLACNEHPNKFSVFYCGD